MNTTERAATARPTRREILRRGALAFAATPLLRTQAAGPVAPARSPKRLIEFGWDEPDTGFLRRHLVTMEKTPFDGCVFHVMAGRPEGPENFAWKFWGRRAYADRDFTRASSDLEALAPTRFTSNFLRVNTSPADLDWFDDFEPVLANARLAARLSRLGRARGVLLDTEQYEGRLFDFSKRPAPRKHTWDETAAQARKRGREVMTAFQESFPDLTVFLTFGPSLVHNQTRGGEIAPGETPYGLLKPFVEGLVEARRGKAVIIDGHEPSYGFRSPDRFADALATIRAASPGLEAGFGLWLDYDWRAKGWNTDDPSRNYFTPAAFESSVRTALERTDGVVWVYTESPRWWTEKGGPEKLPEAYVQALRRARRGLASD